MLISRKINLITVRGWPETPLKIPQNHLFWVIFMIFCHFWVGNDHILCHPETTTGWKPIGIPLNTILHRFTIITIHIHRTTTSNTLFWSKSWFETFLHKKGVQNTVFGIQTWFTLFFLRKRYLMASCTRAYKVHPVMSPKNPNFDKYFLNLWLWYF